jgi:hypothetical protein
LRRGLIQMERIQVESRNIASIGYDIERSILEIEFRTGSIYQYFGVPQHVYEGLRSAGSKGQFFDLYVKKGGYPYYKV